MEESCANEEEVEPKHDFNIPESDQDKDLKVASPGNVIECDTSEENVIKKYNNSSKNKKFSIDHEEVEAEHENQLENGDDECGFLDSSSVKLLQGAVTELERALRDSRALLKSRDDEIAALRKEVEKGRDQVHKEQMKWQRKAALLEGRSKEIQDLKRKLEDRKRANEELQERIKEFESPFSGSDDVSPCCSSVKELIEVKLELAEKDLLLNEIRKNNFPVVDTNPEKAVALRCGHDSARPTTADECDRHYQLKLKFLRDAFFYFMIDFHSEEQMKAILAVLAYGDQRHDVIMQAFHMRQRGKKFFVKEVSSRGLSFLHEET